MSLQQKRSDTLLPRTTVGKDPRDARFSGRPFQGGSGEKLPRAHLPEQGDRTAGRERRPDCQTSGKEI